MNNFDLKKVHELIRFKDVCTTGNDYMKEASCLPRIELETEPLYVLTPKMPILFTPKLRYYRLLIENEINRHINAATELLEADSSEQITKFVLKKTREAVTTLLNEANRLIGILDIGGQAWKNISSDNPIMSDIAKSTIEYVVYLHYVIAELVRCWLELQDRYEYVIGEAGCYDVSLFYTSCLNRSPDKEFELQRSERYNEEAKQFKKVRTDCCFLYENNYFFMIAIQEFTNKLRSHGLIPDDTDYKSMESLFSGHPCRRTYTWLGDNHILTHIVKGLTKDDNPVITTWPEGTSPWQVISCRFVDKHGNPLPNIRTQTERKKTKSIVKEIVDSLAGYMS